MTKIMIFLTTILCCALTINAQGDVDQGLKNFVEYSMYGFSDWVKAEGLDPVLALEENVAIDLTNGLFELHGDLSETYITGLSSTIEWFNGYSTSFLEKVVDFDIVISAGGLSGLYNATGTVLGMYPIGGQNSWKLVSEPFTIYFDERFYVENGYIRLNSSNSRTSGREFGFSGASGTFDGMFDADSVAYEKSIVAEIAGSLAYDIYGGNGAEVLLFHPILYNYLQLCFSNTPVTDIINWPEPIPPTTPKPTTPDVTVTLPEDPGTTPYTESPCLNSGEIGIDSEGLNIFLGSTLKEYPEYLRNNGLDPTMPIISPVSLLINSTFLELTGTFWDSIGAGMSTGSFSAYDITSNFGGPSFSFSAYLRPVKLYGKYEASGMVISIYPLEGAGNWEILDINFHLDFQFEGFAIVDGYIDINEYRERNILLRPDLSEASIAFPDLVTPDSADGFGSEVLMLLGEAVPSSLAEQGKHPIVKSILDYLDFRFSNTPLSEIIATTRPPWTPCLI